jgi:hypothetical protein
MKVGLGEGGQQPTNSPLLKLHLDPTVLGILTCEFIIILFFGPWIFSCRLCSGAFKSLDPFLWNSRSRIFPMYHTLFFKLFQCFSLDHLQSSEIFKCIKLLFCMFWFSAVVPGSSTKLWSLNPFPWPFLSMNALDRGSPVVQHLV